ncbi:hypothetical protein JTB14_029154 [Gonioctena quinquepunctata]|nr:hypothetical protein JTB14_029154 [Gonioctena quinquepunctata]
MSEPAESFESDAEDEQHFEDTKDTLPPEDMPLARALNEAQRAVDDFFNNHFVEAKCLMEPFDTVSMYHALGHSVFLFFEAIMTFERESISIASNALKRSLTISNRFRKKNTFEESMAKVVRGNQFEQYTEIEVHAELCHAESLLLRAILSVVEDETLSSLIKAGFKMRSCFNSFKNCQEILLERNWEGVPTKKHFESGVKVGIGVFNLMISLLPARVTKLLELIGFSGNRELGLRELGEAAQLGGLRQILSVMTTLAYNLIVLQVLGHGEGDMKACKSILESQFVKYPESMWFLFFQGRLEFLQGNLDASQEWYVKSWKSQNIWPQFHYVCFWELFWVKCVKNEWREALMYCDKLLQNNNWSRSLYSYNKAVVMLMIKDELSPAELGEIDGLMENVLKYKQKIAGKSLPMEKFAVKRADRYFKQNRSLVLPIIELMMFWNIFKIFKKPSLATNILKIIEKYLKEVNRSSKFSPSEYDNDNKAVILLAQGTCLRHMGSPLQGMECLEEVISLKKSLVEDHYVIPYAIVELALIEWQNGKKDWAIAALIDARKNYTGYAMESRLQFRIHTALSEFKADAL